MSEELRPIGQVAEATGLSLRTIRYYEEIGLVTPSGRTTGGFRLYNCADVDRLLLIKRMKPLGYPLEEMARLLRLIDALDDAVDHAVRDLGAVAGETPGVLLGERTVEPMPPDVALAELHSYAATVADRVRNLETEIVYAKEFRDRLLDEIARRA